MFSLFLCGPLNCRAVTTGTSLSSVYNVWEGVNFTSVRFPRQPGVQMVNATSEYPPHHFCTAVATRCSLGSGRKEGVWGCVFSSRCEGFRTLQIERACKGKEGSAHHSLSLMALQRKYLQRIPMMINCQMRKYFSHGSIQLLNFNSEAIPHELTHLQIPKPSQPEPK